MKISCTQENLNQGLFVVSHLAAKNTTLPILQNILIRSTNNSIQLFATNLEIGIRCSIRGKIEEEGEFTVQARLLADYVGLLPKDTVNITSPNASEGDQALLLECRGQHSTIKGQSAAEYPEFPPIERSGGYRIDPKELRQAIGQVLFAVSTSETRPEINGVYFSFADKVLTVAATDSYRLAERKIPLLAGGVARSVIVPSRALQEVQRILGGVKDPAAIAEVGEVEVYITDNQIAFVFGGIEITSRLVEGKYPEYQQIVPTSGNIKIVVEQAALSTAVKTASLFARSGIFDIAVKIDSEAQELVVSSTNSQVGKNVSQVPAEIHGGTETIILNYRYLLDGLQNVPGTSVQVQVIDAASPCLLSPTGDQAGYFYLIMPIRQ